MSAPLIRPAVLADADAIATCHVRGWQQGLAGVVDQAYLDRLSVTASAERWRSGLADAEHGVLVAVVDDHMAGFTRAGPTPDPRPDSRGVVEDPVPGELRELYVDPAHWGTAVADQLHGAAVAALTARFSTAVLWVVRGNVRAERFYRRRGWRADGWQRSERDGSASWTEVRLRGSLTGSGTPRGDG